MPLEFDRVYKVTVTDTDRGAPFFFGLAAGIRMGRKKLPEPFDTMEDVFEWVPNSDYWDKRIAYLRIEEDDGGTVVAKDTYSERQGAKVTYKFELLTLPLFNEIKDKVVGGDEIASQMDSDEDLQQFYFNDLVEEDGWKEHPDPVEPSEEATEHELDLVLSEHVNSVPAGEAPVVVLSLGRSPIRRVLSSDSEEFVCMDETSADWLNSAMEKRANIIFECERENTSWCREHLLRPLQEKGYHTVLVMLSDSPKGLAESFIALSTEVDDFCLFVPGSPVTQAWRREGRFPERVLDIAAYEALMETAGLGKWDYFGRPEPRCRRDSLPPAADLEALLALYTEAFRLDQAE